MSKYLDITTIEDEKLYAIVANRRCNYDSMLWQTPVISLTAQAFLLTIALGSNSSALARCISACLAFITAFSSLHLMIKHRLGEESDSRGLEKFEKENFNCKPIHRQRNHGNYIYNYSAYIIWRLILALFGLTSLAIFIIAIVKPAWFDK